MTEAFGFERREPLDDGTNPEAVERIAAALFAEFSPRIKGFLRSVSVSHMVSEHGDPEWYVYLGNVQSHGATLEEAIANARANMAKVPTDADIAATLGIEAENGGIR